MRWKEERRSENVEDRRGQGASPRLASGAPVLLQLLPMLLRSRGGRYLLGILAVVVIGAQFLGIDILSLLTTGGPAVPAPSGQQAAPSAAEQERAEFVAHVLGSTEDTWRQQFVGLGRTTRIRAWSCSAPACNRPAAMRRRRWGRSTAPPTTRSISISRSSTSCTSASARRAISPRPT